MLIAEGCTVVEGDVEGGVVGVVEAVVGDSLLSALW